MSGLALALVLALSSGQVIYEWVDSKGDSHFTDDVSTIPPKAKRRVTQGVEPVVSVPRVDAGAAPAGRSDGGVIGFPPAPPAQTGPDSCDRARQRIQEVEQQAQRETAAFAAQQAREDEHCREVLNLQGRAQFARCMAGRTQSAPASGAAARLDEAKDALRRAQIGGCR